MQEILQQMFRKLYISNRLLNRNFPKTDVGCPCLYSDIQETNVKVSLRSISPTKKILPTFDFADSMMFCFVSFI